MKKALAVRDRSGEKRFFDLFHRDLSRDPLGSMERIYGHFDIPFSQTAQRRMQVWLRDNPRSKFGSHACNAAELGLDPDREKERFGFYVNRLNRTGGDP